MRVTTIELPPGARAVRVRESDPQRRWLIKPDRRAIWLLRQPDGVRRSYVADVLDA